MLKWLSFSALAFYIGGDRIVEFLSIMIIFAAMAACIVALCSTFIWDGPPPPRKQKLSTRTQRATAKRQRQIVTHIPRTPEKRRRTPARKPEQAPAPTYRHPAFPAPGQVLVFA